MIIPAIRQVADWLVDADTGVNKQLATVPGDPGEPVPNLVTVWDASRFPWAATGEVPRELTNAGPLLLVSGPEDAEFPTWPGDDRGGWTDIEVLVAFVARPGIDVPPEYKLRDAYQTLRAAVRALQAPFQTMQSGPTRASVEFARPVVRFSSAQVPLVGSEMMLAGLTVILPAFDAWALGGS